MNYLYDPRIIYFMHVLKVPQATTIKELEGRKKYDEFAKRTKRNKIIKELPLMSKRYNVYLASEKYNFATKIDCVAINEQAKTAYPIQVKYSARPPILYLSQKFQIVMEALLIEEKLGYKVPHGFVKFLKTGDFVKVPMNRTVKEELLKIFSEIERIISGEKLPGSAPHKRKVTDNGYRNIG